MLYLFLIKIRLDINVLRKKFLFRLYIQIRIFNRIILLLNILILIHCTYYLHDLHHNTSVHCNREFMREELLLQSRPHVLTVYRGNKNNGLYLEILRVMSFI